MNTLSCSMQLNKREASLNRSVISGVSFGPYPSQLVEGGKSAIVLQNNNILTTLDHRIRLALDNTVRQECPD